MATEVLGRETSYCKGRCGSMYIADVDTGNIGANGIVGKEKILLTEDEISVIEEYFNKHKGQDLYSLMYLVLNDANMITKLKEKEHMMWNIMNQIGCLEMATT